MKTQPLYRYLSLAALLSIWGCSSTLQTAQNTGETDDLYGSSSNAQVYASASSNASSVTQRNTRQRSSVRGRNANPDYNDEQQYGNGTNTDEYYSELSTRNLNRGISPDPGWTDNSANGYAGTNGYNSGFVNGYNAAQTSALSWNRWGFNNMGFYSGLGLGVGLGYGGLGGFGYSPFNSGFYSPYAYDSFAYGPFGYGGGFGGYSGGFGYSPFYSPFGYSAFGYSPFGYGGGFGSYFGGGYYGGGYGYPGYVNNVIVTGADPYRNNRTYYSGSRTAGRYTSDFDNTNRGYNAGGRRAATGAYANSSGTAPAGSNSNSGYYAPRGGRNNSYYYDNGSAGRTSGNSIPTYSGNANATSTYSAPRGGRGYSNSNDYYSNGGGRSGAQQPSYQAPQRTYQSQSRSYQQPSYQQQQPSYQSQSRSYSQPSFSAPSSGGFSGGSRGGGGSVGGGGGSVGGGGRGPR